jgi:hypothetical protein
MPSIINSDDGVVSGTSGLKTTGGNDGILAFQNNGTESMRIDASGNITVKDKIQFGTDAQTNIQAGGTSDVDLIVAADTNLRFETATNEQARITSAGLFQFNSGYGSVATAYGCRAWVNFNGTGTVAIRASGNVSSITDNGTGDYTVNFTNAMPDINFCSQGFSWASGKNASPIILGARASTTAPHTTSTVRVTTHDNFSESVLFDADYVCVAVFR